MVLTVVLPTNQRRDEEGLTLNYVGCQVTVQKRKPSQFGSASQKWNLDQESGFIYAFHAHHLDVGEQIYTSLNTLTDMFAITKISNDKNTGLPLTKRYKHKHKKLSLFLATLSIM